MWGDRHNDGHHVTSKKGGISNSMVITGVKKSTRHRVRGELVTLAKVAKGDSTYGKLKGAQ